MKALSKGVALCRKNIILKYHNILGDNSKWASKGIAPCTQNILLSPKISQYLRLCILNVTGKWHKD